MHPKESQPASQSVLDGCHTVKVHRDKDKNKLLSLVRQVVIEPFGLVNADILNVVHVRVSGCATVAYAVAL